MEANTMRRPIEPCIDCPDMQVDNYGYLCDLACRKRTAWLNQLEGYQAGIREVVGWLNEHKANPQGAVINPSYTVHIGYEWQAKLKEWGVKDG